MRSAELGKVGQKIREIRKRRKMNLQEVAQKSSITAGLLSRIENFKTLPSLPVLYKISTALEVPLAELVQPVGPIENENYFFIKKGSVPKEKDKKGWMHQLLLNTTYSDAVLKVKKLNIPPGLHQNLKATDQMELIYLEKGSLVFQMKQEALQLDTGDTFYSNGNAIQSIENPSSEAALVFKVHLSRS
jgi:transcriptional regulator with XRE-family HTH domain